MIEPAATISGCCLLPAAHSSLAWAITPAFFWAGAALVAIPIVIHILNRRRFKVVPWAAMEFLLRAMRKNRRRLKFEQWILLATRCSLLLLLGLALARPMGCADSRMAAMAGQRTGLHVFIIDNSYTMAYEASRPEARTHLDHARYMATTLIDRLVAGGESVVLITASAPAQAIVARPSFDLEAAKSAIGRIEQSYSGSDLAGALQLAVEVARANPAQPRRSLYLFTDSTRSAWNTPQAQAIRQAGRELAEHYQITHFGLGRPGQWNQAVLAVEPTDNLVTTRFAHDFSAVVRGFGDGAEALLQWRLNDQALPGSGSLHLDEDTPPQTQSQVSMRSGGPQLITANLVSNDRLGIDNARHRVVNVKSDMKVLIVEGERGLGPLASSGAFLNLALAPPREAGNIRSGRTGSYVSTELISDLELGNRLLGDYRAVILTGVGQIRPEQADQLQQFVRQGGTLLIFMGDRVDSDNYNTILQPRGLMPGTLTRRMSVASDHRGFRFDFRPQGPLHPLLNVFRGEEASGLDTAQIFTYWQLALPADSPVERVLEYLPSELSAVRDPAITLHSLDEGRVAFISTTANAEWTTLPAKPAYVTLMHELLAGSVRSGDDWMNVTVGQPLQVPPTVSFSSVPVLTDPAQSPIVLEQAMVDGQSVYRSPPLRRPGVYHLSADGQMLPIAVNLPSDAADVRVVPNEAIRSALGDIPVRLEGDQIPVETFTREARHDLGWAFMLAVLGLLTVECFMAMRFGHYRRVTPAAFEGRT